MENKKEKKVVAKAVPKPEELAAEVHASKKWTQKNRIYKLSGIDSATPRVKLQSTDKPGRGKKRLLHFDEETGKQRAIRYVVNFESPFIDEQDASGWTLAPEHIVFKHGHLLVDANQVSLQKFLDVHPWNEKNGGKGPIKFYEHDPEAVAKKEVDVMMLEAEAVKAALDADLATTEAVLRPVLGSKLHNLKTDRLTREILLYAKRQPKALLEAVSNDKLLFENVAYTSVDFGIAKISDNGTVYRWASNNQSIVSIPFGQNPYKFLGEWFSSDKGLEVMNKITQKLKKQ